MACPLCPSLPCQSQPGHSRAWLVSVAAAFSVSSAGLSARSAHFCECAGTGDLGWLTAVAKLGELGSHTKIKEPLNSLNWKQASINLPCE